MFHSNYVVLYIQKICMFVQNFLSYFHFSDCSYNIMNTWNGIKGYLRYKTIPAQNVSFEAQVKKMLILQKSYVPFSRFSTFCIFNHSMIYQILCHDEYWYMRQCAFLNISFEPQLIKSPNLGTGTRFQVLFNFATCSNYSVTNYAKIPVFHFFEKVNKGQ